VVPCEATQAAISDVIGTARINALLPTKLFIISSIVLSLFRITRQVNARDLIQKILIQPKKIRQKASIKVFIKEAICSLPISIPLPNNSEAFVLDFL